MQSVESNSHEIYISGLPSNDETCWFQVEVKAAVPRGDGDAPSGRSSGPISSSGRDGEENMKSGLTESITTLELSVTDLLRNVPYRSVAEGYEDLCGWTFIGSDRCIIQRVFLKVRDDY